MDRTKPLPNSQEAEDSVIGSILLKGGVIYDKVAAWIRNPNAFYYEDNKKVWKAMSTLYKDRVPIDTVTVLEKCKDMYDGEPMGYYITGLVERLPTTGNVEQYAKIVWERHIQRETARSAHKLYNISFDDYESVNKVINKHSKLIEELLEMQPSRMKDIEEIVDEAVQNIKEQNNIIPFGIDVLDHPAGGMTKKEVTVLGGRPGHGKTTLMINAVASLIEQGYKVMLFNREMSNTEMIKKLAVMESEVLLYENVRKNEYDEITIANMEMVMHDIKSKYKNLIMYDNVRTLSESMREVSKYKPDVIIDDYIQLIKVDEITEGRRFEIEKIMQEYKWICKSENCTALLISQLNRDIEKRIDPEPKMSDYSESGVIEQTAETALFIFYGYNFSSERFDKYESKLIAAKSRYGTVGSYIIGFNGNKCKFYKSRDIARNATND